jgi:hypothetical protein
MSNISAKEGTRGAGGTATSLERAVAPHPYDLLPRVPIATIVNSTIADRARPNRVRKLSCFIASSPRATYLRPPRPWKPPPKPPPWNPPKLDCPRKELDLANSP